VGCGRVRPSPGAGLTHLLAGELRTLELAAWAGDRGRVEELPLGPRQYAFLLVSGLADVSLGGSERYALGPRPTPFDSKPFCLLVSGPGTAMVRAPEAALLLIGSAPSDARFPTQLVPPGEVRESARGQDNWSRRVRLVCWSDNTVGGSLMVGETVTPSGNWCTIPPHRHQIYRTEHGETAEVPYEEAYYFRFSLPQGFGLAWQFSDDGELDQAFSLKTGDVLYMDGGYHPVACGPGADLYQATFMSGPYRQSTAHVHEDYRHLLARSGGSNPFKNQEKAAR
jgi:5-deoxy-glucuronate isomerase